METLLRNYASFFNAQSHEVQIWLGIGSFVLAVTPFVIVAIIISNFNERTRTLTGNRPIIWGSCGLGGIGFWLAYWSWSIFTSSDKTGWTVALAGSIVFFGLLLFTQYRRCRVRGLIAAPLCTLFGSAILPLCLFAVVGLLFVAMAPRPVYVVNK